MKLRLFSILAATVAVPAVAAPQTYVIEPAHSQPQWETNHVGFSDQRGSFMKLEGKIVLDREEKKGQVDITIDATSIRTFDSRLDAIVKGERFFNVEKFPTITFKSSDVKFDGERPVTVNGELTMLGVTKPVSLTVTKFACGASPFSKKPMCGARATTTIKRSEWGMTNGLAIGNPSDEVALMFPVEAFLEQQG